MPVQADNIPVSLCRPSPCAREVKTAHVTVLARSIEQIGLIQPIVVRKTAAGYEVIAGMHRLSAFRELGRAEILAVVRDDDDLRADLALIDENLIREDLTPAQRSIAMARRKVLYETLHPETVHGAAGRGRNKSRQIGDSIEPAVRFTRATAEATGAGERTVQRETQRGEALGERTLGKLVGTALDKGEELDALARLPEPQREAVIERAAAGEKVSARAEAKRAHRAAREVALAARQAALPETRYGVILADPEWRFEPWSRETGMDRAADNHYPTSCLEVIAARPVATIATADAVLFLWATVPMLPHALVVMAAWGFDYVSHLVWIKDRMGTGYWFRNRHELVLVGRRGNVPAPAPGDNVPSVFEAPVAGHSAKPDYVHELIEHWYPHLRKIELNRRGPPRPGWDAWGNEAEPPAQDADIDTDTGEIAGTKTAYPAGADDQSAGSSTVESSHEVSQSDVSRMPREGPAVSQRSARHAEPEDDGLDIPAFLRRPPPATSPET